MQFQSPGSILLSFGPFAIHWYGLMITLGIIAAFFVAQGELKRRGKSAEILYDLGFWVIISGVLGARLYYVIFQWGYYGEHLSEILMIWQGGLAIHGALIGGFFALLIFCSFKKLSLFSMLDVLSPGLILAQAIGRWGNFFNNEAFGGPTNLPWKLFIPEAFRPDTLKTEQFFHPAFLYESLWNLLGFFLLLFIGRLAQLRTGEARFFASLRARPASRDSHEQEKPGRIFFLYLMFYSFGRFFIESLRTDSLTFGPFRTAQLISVFLFMVGIFGLLRFRSTLK